MKDLNREYTLLFNGITDAINELEMIKARLQSLQIAAETIYMNTHENNEEPVVFVPPETREVS